MRRFFSLLLMTVGYIFIVWDIFGVIYFFISVSENRVFYIVSLICVLFFGILLLYLGSKIRKKRSNLSNRNIVKEPMTLSKQKSEISPAYFFLCEEQAKQIVNYLEQAQDDSEFLKFVNSIGGLDSIDNLSNVGKYNPRLFVFLTYDLVKCFDNLGYGLSQRSKEMLCLTLLFSLLLAPDKPLRFSNLKDIYDKVMPSIASMMTTIRNLKDPVMTDKYAFYYPRLYENYDPERIRHYKVLLYRFSSLIAKADGIIEPKEAEFLSGLMKSDDSADYIEKQETTVTLVEPINKVTRKEIADAAKFVVSAGSARTSSLQRHFQYGYSKAGRIMDELERLEIVGPANGGLPRKVLVAADSLEAILENDLKCKSEVKKPEVYDLKQNDNSGLPRKVLNSNVLETLIGLNSVKAEVKKLTNFIKIQQVRENQGLKTNPISYHCVFTGNPGTGKTTVARIIAAIYKDLGILSKGHLVETDRSGLVAEYVGQTAVKTNKIVDSALDGVLFIDEAYSLAQGSPNDYGLEAISTLLKRMEDDRGRIIVILAGYSVEMKQFIDANPGLHSRFNRYINFEDYSAEELLEIFEKKVKENDYKLSEASRSLLQEVIGKAVAQKDKNFGNARYVRNLFEKTLENQATRLANEDVLTKDLLQEIISEDIPIA